MLRHIKLLPVLGLSICNFSCSSTSEPEVKEVIQQDILVGRIAALYPDDGYMLIQSYRTIRTDINTVFYTRNGQGGIKSIALNEQRLGQFYVADIKGSNFTINDPIFQRSIDEPLQSNVIQ